MGLVITCTNLSLETACMKTVFLLIKAVLLNNSLLAKLVRFWLARRYTDHGPFKTTHKTVIQRERSQNKGIYCGEDICMSKIFIACTGLFVRGFSETGAERVVPSQTAGSPTSV